MRAADAVIKNGKYCVVMRNATYHMGMIMKVVNTDRKLGLGRTSDAKQ